MLWSGLAGLVAGLVAFRLLRALAHALLVRLGLCRYHSPLLYTTGFGRRREIHLGTAKDFLQQDASRRRLLLARVAQGLLALCDEVEAGRLRPDVRFTGTTDLLREATAQRLGFRASLPGTLRSAVTLTAWLQVSLLRSVLRRGPAAVRIGRLRRLQIDAGALAARRPELERLRDRLDPPGLGA